jgi:hypothetical protein
MTSQHSHVSGSISSGGSSHHNILITTSSSSQQPQQSQQSTSNNNNNNNDSNRTQSIQSTQPTISLKHHNSNNKPSIGSIGLSPTKRDQEDGNLSEAETVVLHPSDDVRGRKELGTDGDWRGRIKEEDSGNEEDDTSPRKRRRKSVSRRGGRGDDDDDVDGDYSSDLSSARSSSPMRRRGGGRGERSRTYPQPNSSRKRKAPTDTATSDDEAQPKLETQFRPTRRRNSTLSTLESSLHQTRKHTIRSSSPAPNRLSPASGTKLRSQEKKKLRKVPPPLNTNRTDASDDDYVSDESRQGSPHRHRRLNSINARTPGSPINMSHKPKRDTAGRTHLHRACARGAISDIRTILSQGTESINTEDNAGYMPIHEAALHGHLEAVRLLCDYGAQIDVQSRFDMDTPLLDAVENGHVEVVQLLLSKGADPRRRDSKGRNCIDAIKESEIGFEEREEIENMLKLAIKQQRPTQPRGSDDETRASNSADRDSPSSRDVSVTSPAHQSPPAPQQKSRRRNARAEQSRKDLLWLDAGKGSVNKLRDGSRTGDNQLVHALLETGLKPDTEALIGAIKGGHAEIVSLLLAYDADADPVPGAMEKEGGRRKREISMPIGEETPMLAAIGRGNVEIIKYLLENGADPRRKDSKGRLYHEIAREREGECWQEEVELLRTAWQKAGGSSNSSGEHIKSPSSRHHKGSPKSSRSGTNKLRRNSSASAFSHPQLRTSTKRILDDTKVIKRSSSVNPPARIASELSAVSDRETTAEPLGPPKTRLGRPKHSDSEAMREPKKRRRLVSGKVREQEAAARSGDLMPLSERDSDGGANKSEAKPLKKSTLVVPNNQEDSNTEDKPKKSEKSEKADKAEKVEKVEKVSKVAKVEKVEKSEKAEEAKSDDTIMEDAPLLPLPRPTKTKPTRERRLSTTRSPSVTRDPMKRQASRPRSPPPKVPRSESDKRQEQEQLRRKRREEPVEERERYPKRRDSVIAKEKESGHTRGASVSSDISRRKDESRRANRDEDKPEKPEKPRLTDEERRRRLREKERASEKADKSQEKSGEKPEKEPKEKAPHPDRDISKSKPAKEKIKDRDEKERKIKEERVTKHKDSQSDSETAEREKRRKDFLTKELQSIQDKAKEEAEVHRQDQIIIRELELRRQREKEEQRQRLIREQEERDQEEREAKEKVEAAEREIREQERSRRHRLEQEQATKEREARETREAIAKAESDRIAKEKADRESAERNEREKRELREREERESREREEQGRRQHQQRLAEEEQRRKEDAERKASEERRHREEAERASRMENERAEQLRKEETERIRKAEQESHIARQQAEQQAAEIQRKLAKERAEQAERVEREREQRREQECKMERINSLPYTLRYSAQLEAKGEPLESYKFFTPLYAPEIGDTRYVLNIQVALLLQTTDLGLYTISGLALSERIPMKKSERVRMWSIFGTMLCDTLTRMSMEKRAAAMEIEEQKYLNMDVPLFWIKVCYLHLYLSFQNSR